MHGQLLQMQSRARKGGRREGGPFVGVVWICLWPGVTAAASAALHENAHGTERTCALRRPTQPRACNLQPHRHTPLTRAKSATWCAILVSTPARPLAAHMAAKGSSWRNAPPHNTPPSTIERSHRRPRAQCCTASRSVPHTTRQQRAGRALLRLRRALSWQLLCAHSPGSCLPAPLQCVHLSAPGQATVPAAALAPRRCLAAWRPSLPHSSLVK